MANTCTKQTAGVSARLSPNYADESISELFNVHLDTPTDDPVAVFEAAKVANPTQFPSRGQAWPSRPSYGLFAKEFAIQMRSQLGKEWEITIGYLPLAAGEPNRNDNGSFDDPLQWPRTYRWDWVEYDEAVTEARNVQQFGEVTTQGTRPALTLGPLTNSAHQEFEEGLFDTVRDGVLCIRYNVATLDEISSLEDTYGRTTNSDTVLGRGPRRWKYIGVEDGDEIMANGIKYRPIVVKVQLTKTTDRTLNNVGWKHWEQNDALEYVEVPFTVAKDANRPDDRETSAEPGFLALNGSKATVATTMSYRYLEEVPYAPLILG